jgi:hypothetical protein
MVTVTVTCQYSGIQFEASSKRSKNHPRVAELLADANKKGVYGDVVTAMAQAKRDGITGEAIIEIGKVAFENGLNAAAEFNARWRAEKREKLAQESARIADYRENGPRTATSAHADEDDAAALHEFDSRPQILSEPEIYG